MTGRAGGGADGRVGSVRQLSHLWAAVLGRNAKNSSRPVFRRQLQYPGVVVLFDRCVTRSKDDGAADWGRSKGSLQETVVVSGSGTAAYRDHDRGELPQRFGPTRERRFRLACHSRRSK
jgi:hypothetical protein